MNINELKAELIAAGAREEDLAKVDFANIEHIIDGANDIEGLCKALKEAYPAFDEAAFKRAIAEQTKKTDDAQELSDDDLEAVAGGSVGSWINKNKEWLIPVATVVILGIGYSIFRYCKNSAQAKQKAAFQKTPKKTETPGASTPDTLDVSFRSESEALDRTSISIDNLF